MEVVLDSVSLKHLLRSQGTRLRPRGQQEFSTSLDPHLQSGSVSLALDSKRGLVDEWFRTCKPEYVQQLIVRWSDFGAVRFVTPLNKIPDVARHKLRQLGFPDTVDKLILRIALATEDRTVVSEDRHFWDPKDPGKRGEQSAPVCKLCSELLGVKVLLLAMLLEFLS